MFRGKYGYVNRVLLKRWTLKIQNARAEYYANPFMRVKDSSHPSPKRHWTKSEDRYLIKKRKQGVEFAKIAKHLNRSMASCQGRARKLGLVKKRKPRDRQPDGFQM